MKITQPSKAFQPVTIVLETEQDLADFMLAFDYAQKRCIETVVGDRFANVYNDLNDIINRD